MDLTLIKELRTQLRMCVQALDEGCLDEARRRADRCIGITESICTEYVDNIDEDDGAPQSE